MQKLLLLSHASIQPNRFKQKRFQGGRPIQWMFLCQDYVKFLKWEKALGNGFQLIRLNPELTKVIQQLRGPYLDLITELGRQYDSPAWWSSRISERNTATSSLFLYCCYLRIAEENLSRLSGTLSIVSESWDVLESLAALAEKKGIKVKWVKKTLPDEEKLLSWLKISIRILILALSGVRAKILGHDSPPQTRDVPSIFIHTYIGEDCFGTDGVFCDRYFPGLREWLENKGYSVTTVPVIFNIKRSYSSAWKWLRKSEKNFINPYRYYRISDYLFAIKESWRQLTMPDGSIMLDCMDVTNLFKAEQKYRAFGDIGTLLYYRLPKRLSEAGFRIDIVIAEYENMINEKLLILGFRNYLPSVKMVGFQHGALYPFLLCNLVTQGEAEFAPLPDRVVCNGEFFREILIREGLPEKKAVVGPALRYAYLWNKAMRAGAGISSEPIDVFVPLPMMISDGVELLTKLIQAFGDMGTLRFKLKPHPMTSEKVLLRAAGIRKLPAHFDFVRGKMSDWLPSAKVAIALSSSAIFEIMTFGVPVLVVGREAAIDLNPLGFYADLNHLFYSPEQIRAETLRLLSLSKSEITKYKRRGEEVLRTGFNPVNDETMSVFVDGIV